MFFVHRNRWYMVYLCSMFSEEAMSGLHEIKGPDWSMDEFCKNMLLFYDLLLDHIIAPSNIVIINDNKP